MHNGKSRHIRHRHIPSNNYSTEVISLDYVKFKDNIADLLTKGLNKKLVEKLSKRMRLNLRKE